MKSLRSREESLQSEVTLNSLAARSLRSRRVTSMDELKEHGSDDEASDVEWNGDVPDDAKLWCKALHGLITRALGDDCKGSGEPEWWSENDDLFIELEEERREMPRGSLQPFLRQPYHSDIPITEYVTGRNAKVEALLFGTAGEKLGAWEAFTLFYVKPDGAQWRATEVGQKVTVGHYPFDEDAVVARILRATKPGAHGRMQHCYYVLLKVGENFKYAALQHVHGAGNNLQCISEEWWEDTSFEGHPPAASQLADFTPKSVSAVAKAAAVYVKKLADQVHGDGEQPKKQRKAQHKRSDRARGKAVASDAESDCQSDADDAEDGDESDV